MPNIQVISYEASEGRLREIYDELIQSRGKLADVHMIQSLRPESIVKHMDLYLEIMFSKSLLSRSKREMIATVVSAANQCEYCQIHHGEALNKYWKDEQKIIGLREDYRQLKLSDQEMKLCDYAHKLTLQPELANQSNLTEPLKKSGLEDAAILDATLIIAYFNFVNRIVLAHQLHIEEDAGAGYKY